MNKNESIDLHSGEYAEAYEKKPLSRLMRLKKHIKLNKDSVVVDYACGNSMLLEVIYDSIKEYHGVDFSENMIALAKRRAEKLDFKNTFFSTQDIIEFSLRNQKCLDVAFAMDFSEHVNDEDWKKILDAIRKSLKPDGVFYMHTPNGKYFLEILKDKGVLPQFPEHIAVRDVINNVKLLNDAGFDLVNVNLISHYELRQKPFTLLSYLPFIGEYFKARIFISAVNTSE